MAQERIGDYPVHPVPVENQLADTVMTITNRTKNRRRRARLEEEALQFEREAMRKEVETRRAEAVASLPEQSLHALEEIIWRHRGNGQDGNLFAARALIEIRDSKRYCKEPSRSSHTNYPTFEEYCQDVWDMPKPLEDYDGDLLRWVEQPSRLNYRAMRNHLFDRLHTTGQQAKNDLPNVLRLAIEHEAWKQFEKADGTRFENLVEWMSTSFPLGLGMGHYRHSMSYEDVLQLTKEAAPDVHEVLLGNAPRRKPGPKARNGDGLNVPTHLILNRNGNRSATMLSIRLKQEKPEYYEAYMRGEYKSVTAAAIAAGLLPDNANMRRLKSACRKLTKPEERQEFLEWLKSEWMLSLPSPMASVKPSAAD